MAVTNLSEQAVCPCDMFHHVPMAWLVIDHDLRVVQGNRLFWEEVATAPPSPAGRPFTEAVRSELADSLLPGIRRALDTRQAVDVPGVTVYTPSQPHRVIDLTVVPTRTGISEALMIASSAVGDAGRRVAELTLLHDMIRVLRQEREIARVLFTTLTCATAGSGGLGFNRAWVLLVDPSGRWLEGRMALGPGSQDEAHQIWTELTASPRTLEDFAAAYDRWESRHNHPLREAVEQMRFSMKDEAGQLPVLATVERRAITVKAAHENPWVGPRLREVLGVEEFVVCPMIVSGEPCGVIMADNLYSGSAITRAHVRLLSLFAQHAGIAIEDAQLHQEMEAKQEALEAANQELRETQDELVRAKQLTALGEMSARVAHDLRNPLVTLGGWARVVQEDPDDVPTVVHAANVIAEEASNLEAVLAMLLEPFASRSLTLEPTDVNVIVADTLAAEGNKLAQREIEVVHEFSDGLPPVPADPAQLRRCLVNLVDNAVNAMPSGGTLTVGSRQEGREIHVTIADTGMGMTAEQRERIFDAFYTTSPSGSGLGLAVVWDIIHAHGYDIVVDSEPGHGTTFTIRMPLVGAATEAQNGAGGD